MKNTAEKPQKGIFTPRPVVKRNSFQLITAPKRNLTPAVKPAAQVPASVADRAKKPHIVMRDFKEQFGDVLVSFKEKQIITDYNVLNKLLAINAPIVEVAHQEGVHLCPNCNHIFHVNGSTAAR